VFVVLGHTQCGAVTAVTQAVLGHGHELEANIPPLVDNIQPAVKRAMVKYPSVAGEAIIPHAIEENVWQGMEDLFKKSPATRSLVKRGKVKVVGAIYDVGTGKVNWLPEAKAMEVLDIVESGSNLMVEQIRANAEVNASKTIQAMTSSALPVEEIQKNAEAHYNSVIEGLKAE
jgi:carbonic anhydrase